jgi:drug/metabolite transporter (DMT)-like permease
VLDWAARWPPRAGRTDPLPYAPLDLKGAAITLLVCLLWGANPVAIKIGLADAPPLRLAVFRFVLGGLAILGWAALTGRLRGVRVLAEERRPLLVLGLLFTAQIASMNVGTALTSAAHSAIFLNLYAVHTVVLAHFLIPGDRLTPRRLAGTLVAYGGIAVLFAGEASSGSATLLGDTIMFASGLILGERTVYLARAVQRFDPVRWTARLGLAIAFQGGVVAGFNFIVNLWLLKRYRPSVLGTFFLTQPIFGVVAAALVAGDALTLDLLVASVAVAVGVGLSSR